jgi:hypothetical protein
MDGFLVDGHRFGKRTLLIGWLGIPTNPNFLTFNGGNMKRRRGNYVVIGTALFIDDEENKDAVKGQQKYVPEWQQKVTDEKGRRRFHGAFTGGYSAGYFNSVGSKEGWEPKNMPSSRDKTEKPSFQQAISDFMDEEDEKDFKSVVHTRDEFDTLSIPTETMSFLPDFIAPPSTSMGMKLLEKMGYKVGVSSVNRLESLELKENQFCIGYVPNSIQPRDKLTKAGTLGIETSVFMHDDDNVYQSESFDPTLYDVLLEEEVRIRPKQQDRTGKKTHFGFVLSNERITQNEFPMPSVPEGWVPKHQTIDVKLIPIVKPVTTIEQRQRLLGENNDFEQDNTRISDLMMNRFVSAGSCDVVQKSSVPVKVAPKETTRSEFEWRPDSTLCQRLELPNPFATGSNTSNSSRQPMFLDDKIIGYDKTSKTGIQDIYVKDEEEEVKIEDEEEEFDIPEEATRPSIDIFKAIFEPDVGSVEIEQESDLEFVSETKPHPMVRSVPEIPSVVQNDPSVGLYDDFEFLNLPMNVGTKIEPITIDPWKPMYKKPDLPQGDKLSVQKTVSSSKIEKQKSISELEKELEKLKKKLKK